MTSERLPSIPRRPRDTDRARVYAAEDAALAAVSAGRATRPRALSETAIADLVQRAVLAVQAAPHGTGAGAIPVGPSCGAPSAVVVVLRTTRPVARATGWPVYPGGGVLTLPARGTPAWLVLHELAHVLACEPDEPPHGWRFRGCYAWLADRFLPPFGRALRAAFTRAGLATAPFVPPPGPSSR